MPIPLLLERVVALMHEAVMVCSWATTSGELRVVYVNPAFTRMTDYSYGEIVGLTPQVLWGRQSDRATLLFAARQLRAGRPFQGRVISYRKNGIPFLLDAYVEPVPPSEGGPELFLVVMRDVTEEDPRDAATRSIVAALDHIEEGILVLSPDHDVQYFNRKASELFSGQDGIAIPLPTNAWKQLEQGLTWSGLVEVNLRGEERQLRVDVQPVSGFQGEPGLLVMASDVTDVERLRNIADSVNLSDNLGHFLSGIRHELGNPINSIKTALTVLHANLKTFPAEKVSDYLGRVLGEVGRIEYLLRSLRSFSAHESVVLSRVEVAKIIEELMALVRPGAAPWITFEIDPAPAVSVIADVRAVYQILLNLVSNAIEALTGDRPGTVRIATTLGEDHVDIAVIDDGPGLSRQDLALAMRPFFTTKRQGTGLGLAIARRLAISQGGRLRLLSELARAPSRDELG